MELSQWYRGNVIGGLLGRHAFQWLVLVLIHISTVDDFMRRQTPRNVKGGDYCTYTAQQLF